MAKTPKTETSEVPEITEDMPRWMKYRIENGLPLEDAEPEAEVPAEPADEAPTEG